MPASSTYPTICSTTENRDTHTQSQIFRKTSTCIKPKPVLNVLCFAKYIIIILRNISYRGLCRERRNRESDFLHAENEGYGYP